ncbi:hypothetical protein BH09BAC1_BH09BAC1_14610 [soil metagenome]
MPKLISPDFLEAYKTELKIDLDSTFRKLGEKPAFSADDFEHYILAASLYSSKIEGNTLDENSFFRNRYQKGFIKRKEVDEIENLAKAYKFAAENPFNKSNFLNAHKIFSKTLLNTKEQGKYRKRQVSVFDASSLKPVYMAVEPELVTEEMAKLFVDISDLSSAKLTIEEAFYYASMIHLWIAKIHPFADGNGRAARLAEKWFLASILGRNLWSINTEKYYWDHKPEYYQNIALGFNYYALHWERCQPFLQMLPKSL